MCMLIVDIFQYLHYFFETDRSILRRLAVSQSPTPQIPRMALIDLDEIRRRRRRWRRPLLSRSLHFPATTSMWHLLPRPLGFPM